MCSSLHAKSSHPPLAHHYPGHYQCFYGVNSHLAFLSAERARAAGHRSCRPHGTAMLPRRLFPGRTASSRQRFGRQNPRRPRVWPRGRMDSIRTRTVPRCRVDFRFSRQHHPSRRNRRNLLLEHSFVRTARLASSSGKSGCLINVRLGKLKSVSD